MATTKKTNKTIKKVNLVKDTPKKDFAYIVEKGVAMVSTRMRLKADSFPFTAMNIGDSFLIPSTDPIAKKSSTLHYVAKQYARMQPGFSVTTRILLDGSRRVWRLR